jgi:hypothetical protein
MPRLLARGVASIAVLSGLTVTWMPFHSTLHPYSISQPSSFKRAVLTLDAGSERVDYFSPPLGSAVTNVIIEATPGTTLMNSVSYLRSIDGHNVKRSGLIPVAGQRRDLIRADFNGYAGKYTIEEVSFVASGYCWRLSISYAHKFKYLRPLMLRMIQTFKLNPGASLSKHSA